MVSDASKKKAAQKKAAAAAKRGGKSASATSSSSSNGVNKASDAVAALQLSDRTCTGVLASHPLSRDIHVMLYAPLDFLILLNDCVIPLTTVKYVNTCWFLCINQ